MSSVVISGDTSGAITLSAPAVAGTNTITIPAATGTMLTTASAGTTGTSMVLLGSATASSSATVEFNSLPTSGYSAWKIIVTDVSPATDGAFFQLRYKIGGSTISSNYWYASRVFGSDGGASGLNSGSDTTLVLTGLAMDNSTPANKFNGEFIIPNPTSTTQNKNIVGHSAYQLNGGVFVYAPLGGGYTGATTALDGLYFYMSTGNISTGNIYVYGIKNA